MNQVDLAQIISLRALSPSDRGYILSSWAHALLNSPTILRVWDKPRYNRLKPKVYEALFAKCESWLDGEYSDTLVACSQSDSDYIVGFCSGFRENDAGYEPQQFFVYVRGDYRDDIGGDLAAWLANEVNSIVESKQAARQQKRQEEEDRIQKYHNRKPKVNHLREWMQKTGLADLAIKQDEKK